MPPLNLHKAMLWIAREMAVVLGGRRTDNITVRVYDSDLDLKIEVANERVATVEPPWIEYVPAPDPRISLYCDDQQEIINALKAAGGKALQVPQLVEATGIERSKLSTLLNSLKKRGVVVSVEPNGSKLAI